MNPKVSLIITTYNREKYLVAAIESILKQTLQDFELLIWDDGSSDRSSEIATRYTKLDRRVKFIAAQHTGRGQALKDAIAQTTGKYIGLVDSDDLLAPTALAETVPILDSHVDIGMVYTDHVIIDEQGKVKGIGVRCSIPYSKERLLIDLMTFHFRLMRREIYDRVGGINLELEVAHDYDLCLRFSEITQIYHHKSPLYFYRDHPNSISQSQQLTQILASQQAVNDALIRRGLDKQYQLNVEIKSKFSIRRKNKSANKIFGIGIGKTGTTSLTAALNLLGIKTIHLPRSLEEVKYVDGATDLPIAAAYQELDRLYPSSKFILTIRDTESWLRSYDSHQCYIDRVYQGRIPRWLFELRNKFFGQWQFEPEIWLNTYNRHLLDVTNYFKGRERDLLVLDICNGQGWKELCSFLECPIPDFPFPNENKKKLIPTTKQN
jgi:glycosyltransferase involved in cell wall biosynthesis